MSTPYDDPTISVRRLTAIVGAVYAAARADERGKRPPVAEDDTISAWISLARAMYRADLAEQTAQHPD